MLDVKIIKTLEKNDILVYSEGFWTNLSKEEYLGKIKRDLREFKDETNRNQKLNNDCLETHANAIDKLFNNNVYLAKALYDNFVERGYIDEDKEFDDAFYSFMFENQPLDVNKAPEEFKNILRKVNE